MQGWGFRSKGLLETDARNSRQREQVVQLGGKSLIAQTTGFHRRLLPL
jgi:hypothetical protein